jgi:hypothetical protein
MQNRDFKGKNWRQPQPERQKAVIGGKAASPAAEGIQGRKKPDSTILPHDQHDSE